MSVAGWDHQQLTRKLLRGDYQAVISDSTQLVSISNKDEGCNLYILPDRILPFDIAFAFAKGFQYPALVEKVDEAIVTLQEAGALAVCFPLPACHLVTLSVITRKYKECKQFLRCALVRGRGIVFRHQEVPLRHTNKKRLVCVGA